MSNYPAGVAAANEVLVAVVGWRDQLIPGTSTSRWRETRALIAAVDAWLATTKAEHVNGPDIDADTVYAPLSDTELACDGEPARP